ncbi:iron ABC transporter permease [Streptomyces griseoviridis]|uniref:Iron complex transport system permease protein n=3 Tax=Streptomyces TaxID=1883 RepID=A0ABT9L815_STRGD|nr:MULTISPECIES: iron ABC transporter permease [Streptomyces]MDP9679845.1 iron complex transport system permease protein [Streptomyces griseoviridis]GGS63356.1 iron-hydroxamate transporter permease subunit [Streptomyces niveoruber]GGT24454.1 iron-hydroxamate transporter permease subunit [Streptomyces griseoviridis]GGU58682.1 iron-hydroxamate transporter permease subunit [Streptomyces daghestanicus]GHI30121.1 iron-hydroxamate transporter permease subunit [Streptomyces daghestanicus]
MAVTATKPATRPSAAPMSRPGAAAVTAALVVLVAALAVWDVTQGTADVGPGAVWKALVGQADPSDASVVIASRLPRAAAGLLVGAALGVAGGVLQAVSRNVLASPDTLAVNAGSYLALGVAGATGLSLPLFASAGVAFAGGLAAAAVVLGLSGLGTGTVRLVLAGTALMLGLNSLTQGLLLLFPERTEGLFQWNEGSISQNGFDGVLQTLPVVVIGLAGLLLTARRIDALALGDDAARGLGVPVRATRVTVVVLAALLSAAAVTLAGPIGFVGLCAPALVRPLSRRFRGFARSRGSLPAAALTGAALVLGSDVLLRALLPRDVSVAVPTGTVTSLVGAVFLVGMAIRLRDTSGAGAPDRLRVPSRAAFLATVAVLVVVLAGVTVAGVLVGDSTLLLGDVSNWLQGRAGRAVSFVLDTRVPRVLAALAAGAALALSGTLVQAVTRNPLADPSVLGVSGGAALGAVLLVTTVPTAGGWGIAGAAFAGAGVTAVVVFGLAARGGFRQNRLVLVGIGVASGTTAVISLLIVLTDPFNATKALTWLSGSTYGRSLPDVVPVALVLVAGLVFAVVRRTELDLVSLDEDTPRLLGLRLAPGRLGFLVVGVLLSATAVACAGTIGFVGLVAPHAARALVGRRHVRVVPVAVLLGAALVGTADLLGRTVIAPAQLGAGLMTAVIGTPYFLYLLVRSRR